VPVVRLVDREEYTSQTTGTVEQGETIDVDEDLATLLTGRRGFEYVDEDDAEFECACGETFETEHALKTHQGRWCDEAGDGDGGEE